MALRQVSLVLRPSDAKAKEKTISLRKSPDRPSPSSAATFGTGAAGEQATIEQVLELSEFPLAPGMQLTCQAVATDYHAQVGRSDPRALIVITPDQLLERMAVRQSRILAELGRVLQLQREIRSQVRTLEIRLPETTALKQADIECLQAAEFSQREVARSLTSGSDGLPVMVLELLADLKNNRVNNPDFEHRLDGLLTEFNRLNRELLPPIATELTAAIKGAQIRLQSETRPAGRDTEGQSHLAAAGGYQQQVIASLEDVLARLRQWDDYRRFHREWVQLLRDQEETARKTAVLGAQTVGRDLKELSMEETADLKILAERQLELARRETRLEEEMEQTVASLGQSEPLAAGTLTDAVAEARRLAIAADMSAAGGKIQNNGLGQLPAEQQRILQNVQEVLDILANNRPQELDRLFRNSARPTRISRRSASGTRVCAARSTSARARRASRFPIAMRRRPSFRDWPANRRSLRSRPGSSPGGWSGCWPRKRPRRLTRQPSGCRSAAAPATRVTGKAHVAGHGRPELPWTMLCGRCARSVLKSRSSWRWSSSPVCRTRSSISMARRKKLRRKLASSPRWSAAGS